MQETFAGSCHCRRITFRVSADLSEVVDCNCSVCTKKGFLHLVVEKHCFDLLSGEGDLATYQFNTGVAKHTFCRTCGCQPFYVPRSDPDKIDVNARCLDGIDVAALTPRPFDGANWDEAMRRREQHG